MDIENQLLALKASKTSRAQAAKILNVTVEKFDLILEAAGIQWEKNLRTARCIHVIDGVRDSLEGHAERMGVSVGALRYRLARNQDLAAPIKIVPVSEDEALRFFELRKAGYTAKKAAEEVGRPYNTLKNAAKKLFSDYEEVVSKMTPVSEEDVLRFVDLRCQGMRSREAAEVVGRPYNTLKNVVKKFCPDFEVRIAKSLSSNRKAHAAKGFDQSYDAA